MTLFWFPLEPLEERYTESWSRWFPETFDKNNIDWQEVKGETLTKNIEEGEFLDIYGRPYFALSQIQNFIKLWKEGKVKSGDSLLFADLWHHGIEAIPYIRDLGDKNIKIYGIFHAGSYDLHDFLSIKETNFWCPPFEKAVCRFVDKIFVGSSWSKELLLKVDSGNYLRDKIVVTGLPLKCEEILSSTKDIKRDDSTKLVVFPHRIAPEKGIERMIEIMSEVFKRSDNINLVITSGRDNPHCRDEKIDKAFQNFLQNDKIYPCVVRSKQDYYQLLKTCHVVLSTALQETFGYGVLEAVLCSCAPVVPGDLSYIDILQNDFRFFYNTNDKAVEKILYFCSHPHDVSHYAKKYDLQNTIGRMLEEMGEIK